MFGGFFQRTPAHVCGLYYIEPFQGWETGKRFLPQVKLEAKANILATTSQTVLTQTFANPSTVKGIKECRYTFPLYDGVSVVGFTCHIGERKIVGQVKEREKARAVFQDAVERGETAGLLEQLPDASDVFTTTVGNIPPGAQVVIKITYLGELKHDMEVDGIRFTIPNIICPRYGDYPGTLCRSSATDAMGTSISITVDAEMADGSFIQKIQSPTHPISMTMGTTSNEPNAEPKMTKASASLTFGTAGLERDFVLQVIAKNTGTPKAILENHPTISGHRALMATLVPKFALPSEKPEIVFVCDRSGSMGGPRIELAKQALKVFLKSLPVGVKFNICSFGWQHTFLWEKSVTYSQQTLDEAMSHANTFVANYGGTEIMEPLKATIERRYKDMPLNIMLLTDGEDWRTQRLFSYLNESILFTKAPIRIFTLGIGNGVSHAMIEGIARAGNGFSQAVGEGEPMNTKVVRMLKGALSPHINDYTLEVKYNNDDISAHLDVEPDDDFEIVEKVTDSLKVKLDFKEEMAASEKTKKPISLFDPEVDPDQEEPSAHDETGEDRYAHLPKLHVPKIIQAPQNIPSLFAFHRTSVYLLLGPDAPQGTPISVILRGTSAHGPLELEIPIQVLDKPGEIIHQLAAKKAITELEQGRGWLVEAKDESDTLIKTRFEGHYDDMVEREAVRLGVQFQVGGKWCSFVAVESNRQEAEAQSKAAQDWEWLEDEFKINLSPEDAATFCSGAVAPVQKAALPRGSRSANKPFTLSPPSANSVFFRSANPGFNNTSGAPSTSGVALFGSVNSTGGLFGASNTAGSDLGIDNQSGGGLFGSANPSGGGLFGGISATANTRGVSLFGASSVASAPPGNNSQSSGGLFGAPNTRSGGLFGSGNQSGNSLFAQPAVLSAPSPSPGNFHGSISQTQSNSGSSLFSAPSQPNGGSLLGAPAPSPSGNTSLQDYQMGLMCLKQENKKRLLFARQENNNGGSGQTPPAAASAAAPTVVDADLLAQYKKELDSSAAQMALPFELSGEELVHHLISLQTFAGSWSLTSDLLHSLGLDEARAKADMSEADNDATLDETVLATALVLAIFESYLTEWKGSWELVVEKGQSWLEGEVGTDKAVRCLDRARKAVEYSRLHDL